ncbi:MAG TPA: HAMP domain-containing sensor histidine kinase [Streptosporangiaceae bacterium]
MSRTRRLSLRARMMVMLVGVTTILLLIMGAVSTIVLIHRVDKQNGALAASLKRASQYPLNVLQANPQGYAAVLVPFNRHLAAVPLTGNSSPQLTGELLKAVDDTLKDPRFASVERLAAAGHLDAAAEQARDDQSSLYLGSGPFEISHGLHAAGRFIPAGGPLGGPAMLFVGKHAPDQPGQVRGFIIAELITGAALIALLALAGEWLIGQGLEPLDQMTSTANDITSRGDLTARMPDANDQTEIGRLGASINTMLDRIQQAFSSRLHSEQKVREFAADASHELRTPLTTIRGYAELYRQGALGPDQLPSAMRRIEQEAQRMSTLVAELLELARLDRTSSLDLTETDLASVVRDAVADAVAVEPQRPVRAEAPPRLVAVVDEPRIRQVLANLLGNVRAHTPVSTPVAVRLGEITGGVLIEVADAGPGMSKEDAIRAFDRFHRATDRPVRSDSEDADRQMSATAQSTDADDGRRLGGKQSSHRPGGTGYGGADGDGPGLDFGPASAQAASSSGFVAMNGSAGRNGAARVNGASLAGAEPRAGGTPPEHAAGPESVPHAAGSVATERTSGSGLGLSIVQAIALAHGGRATLESRPGQGTKVRVWLPVRIVP